MVHGLAGRFVGIRQREAGEMAMKPELGAGGMGYPG